jgi:hypothetical protein
MEFAMNCFKLFSILLFILTVFSTPHRCGAADSLSVYIKGYVYDENGHPLKDATISLKNFNLSVSTDSLGKCTINRKVLASLPVKLPVQLPASQVKPVLRSDGLHFSIAGSPLQTMVTLFSLSGKKITDILNATLVAGNYKINLFSSVKSSQPCIVFARIGGRTFTFKAILCGSRYLPGSTPAVHLSRIATVSPVSKKAVTYDSISAAASGFESESRSLDSVEGAHYFFLHTPGSTEKHLDISFTFNELYDPAPSLLTAVWLEDTSKTILKTLYVSSWLSGAGYRMAGICPDWVGQDSTFWATQRSTDTQAVDAVTHPTPINGKNSIYTTIGNVQNTVRCCVETHIDGSNNILYSSNVNLQSDTAQATGSVTYVPGPGPAADIDVLSEVRFSLHK